MFLVRSPVFHCFSKNGILQCRACFCHDDRLVAAPAARGAAAAAAAGIG